MSKKQRKRSSTKKKRNSKAIKAITPAATKMPRGMKAVIEYGISLERGKKLKFKTRYVKMIEKHMAQGGLFRGFAQKIGIDESSLRRWLSTPKYKRLKDAAERGLWEFIKSLPEKLIEHMAEGLSFESFGGTVNRSRAFLYDLVELFPAFKEAKETGYCQSMASWEKLSVEQAAGTLMRISKKIPMLDKDGDPMLNEDGEERYSYEYSAALGQSRSLIFIMQRRFEEYREASSGNEDNYNILKKVMEANEREKKKKIKE